VEGVNILAIHCTPNTLHTSNESV